MLRKLTRREAADFLTRQGYKTSVHPLNRLCGPAVGQGPPSDGRWGNRELYTGPTLLSGRNGDQKVSAIAHALAAIRAATKRRRSSASQSGRTGCQGAGPCHQYRIQSPIP